MLGKELFFDDSLSKLEKCYIKLFGMPVNGLRIRARRILPLVTSKYKKIMDAGCGPGIFTFEIARRFPGSVITGFDIEEGQLETNRKIAERAGIRNCIFERQDICNMNFENRFDLIISIDNLEHISDDDDALKRLYNALSSGGDIILHVPGLYRRWPLYGWAENFSVPGHCRPGYTKEKIVDKVINAGFEIKKSYYTYGWIETITNNISYLITRAEMKNKHLYALVFPLLLFASYFGKNSRPEKGAGVLVVACKNNRN